MADYDLVCVNCFHKSHLGKDCPYCPLPTKENPNARCTQFVRADLFIARAMARIEEGTGQMHGQLMAALSTIFDMMCEVWPEAKDSLEIKLKERQAESERQMEEARVQRLAEAEAAYKNATETAAQDALVAQYTTPNPNYAAKSNLVKFPTKEVVDEPTDDSPTAV